MVLPERFWTYLRLARPNWHKGFLFIGYFLLFTIISAVFGKEWVARIFAWPLYLFRSALAGSVLELAFVYVLVVAIDIAFFRRQARKTS